MKLLELERLDETIVLRFNREKSYNAMNGELITQFNQAVIEIEKMDCKTVILTGKGTAFSAGGDVKTMLKVKQNQRAAFFKILTTPLHNAILNIVQSKKIWIAAVNGIAAGAGVSAALSCDLTVASENAKFILSYEKIGLTPDGGSTFFLNEALGSKKALEILLTDPLIDSAEALKLNLIYKRFGDSSLISETLNLAQTINNKSYDAMLASKMLIRKPYYEKLKIQLEREAESISRLSGTDNASIGMNAFANKEKALFK